MSSDFAYLHVHTYYSRSGGRHSPEEWCARARELGYRAIGVAGRSPMADLPSLSTAASSSGLNLVYGVELDVLLPLGTAGSGARKPAFVPHMVLLFARGAKGLAQLARLSAIVYARWPGLEEPISWDALAGSAGDLVVALPGGDEAGALAPFVGLPPKKLAELGAVLRERFGDALFVGLPHAGRPGDGALAAEMARAASHMRVPTLALPLASYLRATDAPAYEALRLARSQAGWRLADPQSPAYNPQSTSPDRPGPYYLRAPDEAAALFKQWPEALENAARVLELCATPETMPAGEDSPLEATSLRALAERRLRSLLGAEELSEAVAVRLNAELSAVQARGASTAWLALAAVCEQARRAHVPLGAPLGAADGSLLAYVLGAAPVQPPVDALPSWLAGGSAVSALMPGVEVPGTRRSELVSAVAKEFGADRLAHAACAVEVTPLQAVRAAGMALGASSDEVRSFVADVMASGWDALQGGEGSQITLSGVARSLCGTPLYFRADPEVLALASPSTLPWLAIRNPQSAIGWLPWTEHALSAGYPTLCLGSSGALVALDRALSLAKRHPASGFSAEEVDLRVGPGLSGRAASIIPRSELDGIPYISAKALKGWKGELTEESCAALVASSLTGQPLQDPKITGHEGPLLYKDQLEAVLRAAAGLSPEDASKLRRALGSRELPAEEGWESRFMSGCVTLGMPEEVARELWSTLFAAAPKLISRHVAAAHARTTMWCTAVKGGHPAAFLAGALDAAWRQGGPARVAPLAEEARRLGVLVLGPDAGRSLTGCTLEGDGTGWAVCWGLALLPGWSLSLASSFVAARPGDGFKDLSALVQAAVAAGLSASNLQTLARAGGCDSLGGVTRDRWAVVEALPRLVEWAERTRRNAGQLNLFSTARHEEKPPSEEGTVLDTPLTPRVRFALRTLEEGLTGVGFTPATEMDNLRRALDSSGALRSRLLTTRQVGVEQAGQSVYLVGLLSSIELVSGGEPKGGPPLAIGQVEDLDSSIELVAFPPNYRRHQEIWVEGNPVIVTGRVSLHADGGVYLVCEHLAPFHVDEQEEEISVKVKAQRRSAAEVSPEPQEHAGARGKHDPADALQAEASTQTATATKNPQSAIRNPQLPPVTGSPTYRLIITIPDAPDDQAFIDSLIALNSLLCEHPGPDAVTVRIPYSPPKPDGTRFIATAQLPRGVTYSSYLEVAVRDLLGLEALAIIQLAA